jgi:cytochrome b561
MFLVLTAAAAAAACVALSLGDRASAPDAKEAKPAPPAAAPQKPIDTSLDFDLLGKPAPPPIKFDDAAMKQRRTMLDYHQKIGLGLVALQLATTVVGQLNYTDKYGTNPAVTGKYELPHTVLAYSTLAVFAVDGSLALFAPSNPVKKKEYDRMTIHKVGMAIATAGMVAQGVVGIRADQLEGRIDQASVAKTHLVIGYVTLAAVAVAVGALVF